MRELELYPYTKKTDTVNPYFTPTDLKRTYPEVNFRAAITDAGMRVAIFSLKSFRVRLVVKVRTTILVRRTRYRTK